MTVYEQLKGVTGFTVSRDAVEAIANRRRVALDNIATDEVISSRGYRLMVADMLMWCYLSPDFSQGDLSISLTEAQREAMKAKADAIYAAVGGDDVTDDTGVSYGYKGKRI
jgi:hypothetical protein